MWYVISSHGYVIYCLNAKTSDLRTLKSNLDDGTYKCKEEFYADAKLIFENGILFNKNRDSAFVVKLAESMLKAFEKLRKSAEKKAAKLAAKAGGGG